MTTQNLITLELSLRQCGLVRELVSERLRELQSAAAKFRSTRRPEPRLLDEKMLELSEILEALDGR